MAANWSSIMDLPPGFGFHPSNEVLIKDYLRPKIMGINDPRVDNSIPTIDDLCKSNPSELPSLCWRPWNREHCYFFCNKWKQYGKGTRCDRKTKTGYWKKTGKELPISDSDTGECIGKRSILVFYEGRIRGKKTDYVIHVYEIKDDIFHQSAPYVICRLQIDANKTKKTKNKADTPSATVMPDLEIIQGETAVIPGRFLQSQDSSFFDGGEPSVNTTSDGDIPLAPSDTQEVGGGFEWVDSEPEYSPEGHHNGYVDPESSFTDLMGMFYVPQDGSGGTTDEVFNEHGQLTSMENMSFLDGSESSGIVTFDSEIPEAPAVATQVFNSYAAVNDESSLEQPLYSPDHNNQMIASYLFDESLPASPDENLGTLQSLDSFSSQPMRFEMTNLPKGPVSREMDAEGVDGGVNFPVHQLARGFPNSF